MKMQKLFAFLAAMGVFLDIRSAKAQNPTINIMPMGDSVTARGGSPESSYRYWLYTYLTNAGFSNTMFVGNQNGVSDGAPANSWPQEAYEGGSRSSGGDGDGWTTQDGVNNAASAAGILNSARNGGTYPGATILLLDLGANDCFAGEDAGIPLKTNLLQMQQNLETIIQTFAYQNPSTVVLLAVPTPWAVSPPDPVQNQFMAQMGTYVSKAAKFEKKAGVHVVVVHLRSGFNPSPTRGDTKDGSHPDVAGEQLIAKRYFSVLRPILKKMEKQGL